MTQKFNQSQFRIQTRRQGRHCSEGPRPRRLTKVLQPSSLCPMEVYQSGVGLNPDGLNRRFNVIQKVIHPMRRTHETLHPSSVCVSTKEITHS